MNLDLSIEYLLGFDSETNRHINAMQKSLIKEEEQKMIESERPQQDSSSSIESEIYRVPESVTHRVGVEEQMGYAQQQKPQMKTLAFKL